MSKFSVLVADPPYQFDDKLQQSSTKRGAEDNYDIMTNSDLLKLPIKDIAEPNGSVLALWVPSSLLEFGLQLMNAYGFQQKQSFIWVKVKKNPLENLSSFIKSIKEPPTKDNFKSFKDQFSNIVNQFPIQNVLSFFMGRLYRQTHELCLIGTNGNGVYKELKNKSQRSVCFAENLKHSAKPEYLQDSLEIMFPTSKKIEIFARRQREGWACLGNEIGERKDIRVSLQELIENENSIIKQ